jgi:hypothetical protein
VCRSTWKPPFDAASHGHFFASSGCGGMMPALTGAGFQVRVLHVFTATALPNHVVSKRRNFLRCPSVSGFPHGGSTSTGENAST